MKKLKISRTIQWLLIIGLIFLVLMTGLRIAQLCAFPKPATDQFSMVDLLWMGIRFDARMVGIATLFFFLISLIKPLNPFDTKRGKVFAFSVWTVLIFVFLVFYIADFANYAYLGSRLNANVTDYMKDTKASLGMIWETYPVIWILLVLILSVIFLNWIVRVVYKKVQKKSVENGKFSKVFSPIVFFLLLAFIIFGRLAQFPLRWSDAFTLGSSYASNMSLNPFQAFFSSLKYIEPEFVSVEKTKKYYTPVMTDYLGIKNIDTTKLNYTRLVKPDSAAVNKPNIVIVLCESFSYLKSSMSGNKLNPTPYFDSLTHQGVLFTRAFSPSYGTARGVWALLTGEPDTDPGKTTSRNPNAVNQHLIFNDFNGYDKFYFLGGSLSWANIQGVIKNNVPNLKTYEQEDFEGPKINVWGVSDNAVFKKANEVFSQQTKPFVSIIQTADNHRPYTIPDEDKEEFKLVNYGQKELLENGFTSLAELNAFRYTDFCFRKFMESAKKEKYFANTIFVFVGDHGTKGDASKYYSRAWNDGQLVFMHVPLFFYAPALLKPEKTDNFASQIDIFPTVAGLAKINYSNTTLGRDLFSPELRDNPAASAAFIYNPMMNIIGIVKDSVFYSESLNDNMPVQVWNLNNNNEVHLQDSTKEKYHNLTKGIFHTGRYMILNNKNAH